MKRFWITLLITAALAVTANAYIPHTMNIQGVLTDDTGATLPDNSYMVEFGLWKALSGGNSVWSETLTVFQEDGVFQAVLGAVVSLEPDFFEDPLWLSMSIEASVEVTPRLELTSVATAIRAASVGQGAAVRSLNGLRNDVILQAGANITITQVDTTLVIASTGVAGDDGDWVVSGTDIYRTDGRVFVGTSPAIGLKSDIPTLRGTEGADKDPTTAKMSLLGVREGLISEMVDSGSTGPGLSAVFGKRSVSQFNPGIGFAVDQINTAISGYNDYGDSYTFGVAGHTWFDSNNTGGILGAHTFGTTWGALAYRDSTGNTWGSFTPNDAHVGGTIETTGLRVLGGAAAGQVLTSDASGYATWQTPSGGDDGDWTVSGADIYRPTGRVIVGENPTTSLNNGSAPLRGADAADKDPATAKMRQYGVNEGFLSEMVDSGTSNDGLAAIFGKRNVYSSNPGTGFGVTQTNTAVTGYNNWGDSYTFGVAGHTWFDNNNTGGVLGADYSGANWGALAFRDDNGSIWGLYTPQNIYSGGLIETTTLQVAGQAEASTMNVLGQTTTGSLSVGGLASAASLNVASVTETGLLRVTVGATPGYILTSDASGNASWTAPATTGTDDDWVISGNNLSHSTSGTVAIGTNFPTPFEDSIYKTTLQISSLTNPALTLDSTSGGFTRWSFSQSNDALRIAKSTDPASVGNVVLDIDEGMLVVNDWSNNPRIRLIGEAIMMAGPILELYSTSPSTSLPTVVLDAQDSSSHYGGSLTLRDQFGQDEVIVTADYNGTNVGRVITPVLEITGGSDLSEQFEVSDMHTLIKPGMVMSIDPENPGQLTLSSKAYDKKVVGVISGAGGVNTGMVMGQKGSEADGNLPVALVGRVYVWADASAGPIEPGDMLTTADRPGHAMRVSDHAQASGAILGKAMTGLEKGQGLILTLVSLQ